VAFNGGVVSLAAPILRNQEARRETETAGHPLTFKHVIKHATDRQAYKRPELPPDSSAD